MLGLKLDVALTNLKSRADYLSCETIDDSPQILAVVLVWTAIMALAMRSLMITSSEKYISDFFRSSDSFSF